jgi:hypothetical protein
MEKRKFSNEKKIIFQWKKDRFPKAESYHERQDTVTLEYKLPYLRLRMCAAGQSDDA